MMSGFHTYEDAHVHTKNAAHFVKGGDMLLFWSSGKLATDRSEFKDGLYFDVAYEKMEITVLHMITFPRVETVLKTLPYTNPVTLRAAVEELVEVAKNSPYWDAQ